MFEWMNDHAEKIAAGALAVGGILAALWAKLQSLRTDKAKTSSDVAIAESQREVYEQMKERMTMQEARQERLEKEVDDLRNQVREKEDEVHKLKLHIKDLEAIMRAHSIPTLPMPL